MIKVLQLLVITCLVAGCGNQMMRQRSFRPLATPRAAPPAGSVPYTAYAVAWDAAPVQTSAFGNNVSQIGGKSFEIADPTLPPPDLSDNALKDPSPKVVDAIRNPLITSVTVLHSGATNFLNRCVQCHSPSGVGIGPVGGYLSPPPANLADPVVQKRSDGALFWQITMGSGKMPGFKHWTTPEQRWALVEYVRSLKGGRRNAQDTPQSDYPVYGSVGFERRFSSTD